MPTCQQTEASGHKVSKAVVLQKSTDYIQVVHESLGLRNVHFLLLVPEPAEEEAGVWPEHLEKRGEYWIPSISNGAKLVIDASLETTFLLLV